MRDVLMCVPLIIIALAVLIVSACIRASHDTERV